jgi:hypothetical protein
MLILTADQDYAPIEALRAQIEALPPNTMTMLLTDPAAGAKPDVELEGRTNEALGNAASRPLAERGVNFGAHPSLVGIPTEKYKEALVNHARNFHERFEYQPTIVRNHHLVWEGAVKMARYQAMAGFRMNLDYMASAVLPHGELGFMTGSALPSRFITEGGELLPIYQQATQLDDHVLLDARFGYRVHTVDALIRRSKSIISRATRYRLPVTVNHHPYWWAETGNEWQSGLVETAQRENLAIWHAGSWLNFTDSRRAARLAKSKEGVVVDVPASGLAIVLEKTGNCSDIRVDGQRTSTTLWKPLSVEWCIVPLSAGRRHVTAPH